MSASAFLSKILLPRLTTNLLHEFDQVETGTTCRAAVGTLDPGFEAFVVKKMTTWLQVCYKFGIIKTFFSVGVGGCGVCSLGEGARITL